MIRPLPNKSSQMVLEQLWFESYEPLTKKNGKHIFQYLCNHVIEHVTCF